jgi:hypothetical protein
MHLMKMRCKFKDESNFGWKSDGHMATFGSKKVILKATSRIPVEPCTLYLYCYAYNNTTNAICR